MNARDLPHIVPQPLQQPLGLGHLKVVLQELPVKDPRRDPDVLLVAARPVLVQDILLGGLPRAANDYIAPELPVLQFDELR